jgi:hypothetical protein
MSVPKHAALNDARDRSLEVRALYEVLEQRLNGKVWSNNELMMGFSNDVGYIGRLLLAHEGTWDIDGDATAELEHKLSESLWWIFVLADRLDIDMTEAFNKAMDKIGAGLGSAVTG